MNKKFIILGSVGAILIALIVAGGIYLTKDKDNTPAGDMVENPPAQSSTPVEPVSPSPDPVPEAVTPEPSVVPTPDATPSEPEKAEPSKEPEKEPVVTDPPKVNETPEPSVEPEPVATPEPTPEVTPTVKDEPVVENPYDVPAPPVNTEKPTGPDESNKQAEKDAEQARQDAAGKFTYPPNSTTQGLTDFQINSGMYIDKSTGIIYNQEGQIRGKASGYDNNGSGVSDEQHEQNRKDNKENADKIYDGSGEGSDTSGFNG